MGGRQVSKVYQQSERQICCDDRKKHWTYQETAAYA